MSVPEGQVFAEDQGLADEKILAEIRRRGLEDSLEPEEQIAFKAKAEELNIPQAIDESSVAALQQLVNRGLQSELSEEETEVLNEYARLGVIQIPKTGSFDLGTREGISAMQRLLNIDPNVDQSGVPDIGLRAEISKGDTPEEQEARLKKIVGEDGFTRDAFGNLSLTPTGADQFGITTDIPVRIDERFLSTGDIGDLRGIAPAIAGGVAAGVMTGGAGVLPAIGATALGAMGGKGFDETIEALTGENLQSPTEVAGDLAIEGASAAGGEAFFRGLLAPLGRKILRPNQPATRLGRSKIEPGARKIVDEAREIGALPNITNVQNRAIINRLAGMVETVLGDPNVARNVGAIRNEMSRLRKMFRASTQREVDAIDFVKLGEGTREAVIQARKAFGDAARKEFALVDEILKGRKIIPTAQIKAKARQILSELPREERIVEIPPGAIQDAAGNALTPGGQRVEPGRVLLTDGSRVKDLMDVQNLPDFVTVEQLQGLRNSVADRLDFGTVTPGLGHRDAARLLRGADRALDEAVEQLPQQIAGPEDLVLVQEGLAQLKSARNFYRDGIAKFKNSTIARIARDPGDYAPESIIDEIFNRGKVTPMRRVMEVVSDKQANEIRSAAMEKILDKAVKESRDPITEFDFDGFGLQKALNRFGDVVNETFGAEATDNLHRLSRVMQIVERQRGKTSGTLVAATLALRAAMKPLSTLSTVLKLRVLSQVFSSKTGQRWLIEGFEAKNTRQATGAISRLASQIKWISERETGIPAQSIGVSLQDDSNGQ